MERENECWFIRHGQSEANAGHRPPAEHSAGLTAVGELQAEAIARWLPQTPTRIVCSPFLRARQTAEPTIARFPRAPVETWNVQEFTYLESNSYRDTTIVERRPLLSAYWDRLDPKWRDGLDAETFVELFERTEKTLAKLRAHRGLMVVFSHGQFMRAIAWLALCNFSTPQRKAMRSFSRFRLSISVPNGAVIKLHFSNNERPAVTGPDVSHLPSEMTTH